VPVAILSFIVPAEAWTVGPNLFGRAALRKSRSSAAE